MDIVISRTVRNQRMGSLYKEHKIKKYVAKVWRRECVKFCCKLFNYKHGQKFHDFDNQQMLIIEKCQNFQHGTVENERGTEELEIKTENTKEPTKYTEMVKMYI